jgi:hypothetical protein
MIKEMIPYGYKYIKKWGAVPAMKNSLEGDRKNERIQLFMRDLCTNQLEM